ncbi:hypothetical protein F6Y05_33805 [Bacillus megaterium]|nr:hypothetical protein [Priestia megaterium]
MTIWEELDNIEINKEDFSFLEDILKDEKGNQTVSLMSPLNKYTFISGMNELLINILNISKQLTVTCFQINNESKNRRLNKHLKNLQKRRDTL